MNKCVNLVISKNLPYILLTCWLIFLCTYIKTTGPSATQTDGLHFMLPYIVTLIWWFSGL